MNFQANGLSKMDIEILFSCNNNNICRDEIVNITINTPN